MIDTQMTSEDGKYMFISESGKYSLLASRKGYSFPSKKSKNLVKTAYGSLISTELKEGKKIIGVDIGLDPMTKEQLDAIRLKGGTVGGEEKFGSPFVA